MVVEIVKFVMLWINYFPNNGWDSTTIKPRGVITIMTINLKRHCKV